MTTENKTRTLIGLEALGYALLHEMPTVTVGGVETPIEDARVASYNDLDSVTVEATLKPCGWTPRHIQSFMGGCASVRRAQRVDVVARRPPSYEEYVAAGKIATEERALWDVEDAKIKRAGWRPSGYHEGKFYKVGADAKPVKKGGQTWLLSRREVLAEIAKASQEKPRKTLFVFTTDTFIAAVGKTRERCLEDLQYMPTEVIALFQGKEPQEICVDDLNNPNAWSR